MNINYERYKFFYYVAYYQSFTKAARKLYVTQSSVSQSIKALENELGSPLFSRNQRHIQLTYEGELLFADIAQAVRHITAGEKKLTNLKTNQITIGASDTLCKYVLLPYFKIFRSLAPDSRINISNQPSQKTLDMIEHNLIDFGIVTTNQDFSGKNIELKLLKQYSEVLVAGQEIASAIGLRKVTFADFEKYPLITLKNNTGTRAFLDQAFAEQDYILEPSFEVISIDLIMELIKASLGIGFIMEDALVADSELVQLNFQPPLKKRNICIAYHRNARHSVVAERFIHFMLSQFN